MRKLVRTWTYEETELLKKLHASGASALRASLIVKRNRKYVMARARQLGIPFLTLRESKNRQAERERADKTPSKKPDLKAPAGLSDERGSGADF